MNLKIGDVVRLNSGGPEMTIGNLLSGNVVRASWFVGASLKRELFHTDQLVKVA